MLLSILLPRRLPSGNFPWQFNLFAHREQSRRVSGCLLFYLLACHTNRLLISQSIGRLYPIVIRAMRSQKQKTNWQTLVTHGDLCEITRIGMLRSIDTTPPEELDVRAPNKSGLSTWSELCVSYVNNFNLIYKTDVDDKIGQNNYYQTASDARGLLMSTRQSQPWLACMHATSLRYHPGSVSLPRVGLYRDTGKLSRF